jgi:DedD protein
MEKKKLLLVAVSVGVFLVIIISATILIISSKPAETGVTSARPIQAGSAGIPQAAPQAVRTQPATVDAADMVRNAGDIQGIQSPPPATAIQENNFYINGENPEDSYTLEKTGDGSSTRVVINVPKPSTAAVPDTAAGNKNTAAGVSAPAGGSSGRKSAAAVKPAPPKSGGKTAAAAVKPVSSSKGSSYWVQTGAFSAKVRAENAKEILASKGITSIIENREVEGKTWYRVRVGPYTSENEANYWLSLVKSIDGFAGSQVRLTGIRN